MALSIQFQIDEAIKGLVGNVSEQVGKMAFASFQAVVVGTPVDTGRARGNWIPAIGKPPTRPVPTLDKSGTAGLGNAKTLFARYDLGDGKIFIVNNLPYIQRLNEGHSQQAPAGFVQRAVLAGVAVLDRTGDISR